jgi:hypothetical protein
MIERFTETRVFERSLAAATSRRAVLPVRRERIGSLAVTRGISKPSKPAESIWINLENDGFGEKLMLLLLVMAAVGAIAYCFSSLLDPIQGWGVFHAWVGQAIQ